MEIDVECIVITLLCDGSYLDTHIVIEKERSKLCVVNSNLFDDILWSTLGGKIHEEWNSWRIIFWEYVMDGLLKHEIM